MNIKKSTTASKKPMLRRTSARNCLGNKNQIKYRTSKNCYCLLLAPHYLRHIKGVNVLILIELNPFVCKLDLHFICFRVANVDTNFHYGSLSTTSLNLQVKVLQ